MKHVEVKFHDESQSLGRSGDPKRLQRLRNEHHFPSDGRGIQLQVNPDLSKAKFDQSLLKQHYDLLTMKF
jgi:hypothetical protein